MTLVEIAPWVAGVGLTAFAARHALGNDTPQKGAWVFPAALSALFLAWSIWAVVVEGPLGFWTEHTRNLWGNQIWFDLLFAAGIGWFFIVPPARKLGMQPLPWLVVVLTTGCIGLLAMTSRFLYLRERRDGQTA